MNSGTSSSRLGSVGPRSIVWNRDLAPLLLTLLLIAIGWYLIVRPQQVRLREQREMVRTLEVGDRVITAGGFHGTLVAVEEETVVIRLAPDVEVTLARPAISRRLGEDHHPPPHLESESGANDLGGPRTGEGTDVEDNQTGSGGGEP